MLLFRLTKLIITFLFFLFFYSLPLRATEINTLNEDFGFFPLDENIWKVYENDGSISVEDSWIILSSSNEKTYPYIHLKNDLISKSESCTLELKFKYKSFTPWGVGISVGNSLIKNGTPLSSYNPLYEDGNSVRVWAESTGYFRVLYKNCNQKPCSKQNILLSSLNTKEHVMKFKFLSQNAEVFLDNTRLGTFELAERFKIWFGNPVVVENNLTWTQIAIDYIKYSCQKEFPLLIIPGLGASWNTRAMVYGENVPDSNWRMTPFVNIYNRLIETAKNNDYQLGENLFVWNYDWRRPLPEIATKLNQFIENNPSLAEAEKINIVGHSLGGLVARAWAQESDHASKVNKLIAVGSPHQGAVQAYQALAGGQVSDKVNLGWLAMQLLLQIHRQGFETNAEIIRNLAPVLQDIVPTFDFLKKYRRIINYQEIRFSNSYLEQLNQDFNLQSISYFLVGKTGTNTPEWLWLRNRSLLDQILDLWPEGRPYRVINGEGDGTVLTKSAQWQNVDHQELNLNHHQIIADPESVRKIMELIGKPEAQIAETDPVYPSDNLLIFYLASPARLRVDGYQPEIDDLQFIVIPNPEAKTYQVELTGIDQGTYHLYLGQITPSGNFWQTYQGQINPQEKVNYQFVINFNQPQADPLIDQRGLYYLKTARSLLEKLQEEAANHYLSSALNYLNQAIELVNQENWSQAINKIKKSLFYLARFQRQLSDSQINQGKESLLIMENLAQAWEKILKSQNLNSRSRAYQEYRRARAYFSLAERLLRLAKRKRRPIPKTKAFIINQDQELIGKIKSEWDKENYSFVEPRSYFARLTLWAALIR